MKNHRLCCTILIVVFVCVACSNNQRTQDDTQGKTVENAYASGFEMSETDNGYSIQVMRPWQQATDENFTYSLSREEKQNSIKIPVDNVVCMSTTHIAYLEALGELSSVSGLTSTDFVYSKAVKNKVSAGEIQDIGFSENLNLEKIIALKPDVVFAYVIQASELRPLRQLEELGIPVVLVGDYLEQTPMAKMEWLRFFACFYDKIPLADHMIDSISVRYDSLKNMIPTQANKPKVLTNVPWQGVWWVPGGDSYLAQLIEDAGGDYLFADYEGTESHAVDIELVYQRANNADVWIHSGDADTYTEVFNADRRLVSFNDISNLKVYNNNRRQSGRGNDFFESAVVYPDRVLSDLIQVFYPEAEITDSLMYYKPLIP
ncbi:MAG: ABC transporter substrate-binding protein [Bacteroidota bacterium]|nr:ABC transporter substrate-binding protein [Bacteroidota bacterium]